MTQGTLEHVNVTVSDPDKTAKLICDLFDWQIRWQGPSALGGRSVHVGTDAAYVAVYTRGDDHQNTVRPGITRGGLNHIGIVVDDLNAIEAKIQAAGFHTHSHADYPPGRRFYFNDHDDIEYEIVSYA